MKRSSVDLSFMHQTTLDMGYLIPIAAIDVLPGDTFRSKVDLLARVAPLAKPVMHPVQMRVHSWFVPNRLLWEDWEDFIVGNEGAVDYPTIAPATAGDATLYDYMGAEPVAGVSYDALPVRAYNLIWNEYYRDQDLSAARVMSVADGVDSTTDTTLARVAWGKDYFTTARAQSQDGSSVSVAFAPGSTAPVTGIWMDTTATGQGTGLRRTDGTTTETVAEVFNNRAIVEEDPNNNNFPNVRADLSQLTTGIDVNELRRSFALQRISEARNYFGSRYEDFLRWYGVNPRDGRLSRPEYLGGGSQTISFSEVLATADSGTASPGDLYGHGIAGLRQRPVRKMFEEHGSGS